MQSVLEKMFSSVLLHTFTGFPPTPALSALSLSSRPPFKHCDSSFPSLCSEHKRNVMNIVNTLAFLKELNYLHREGASFLLLT